MEDYEKRIEGDARDHISGALIQLATRHPRIVLPLLNSKNEYVGELNSGTYQTLPPHLRDPLIESYLLLKDKRPGIAGTIAATYSIREIKNTLLEDQDFEAASALRDKEKALDDRLIEVIEKEFITKLKKPAENETTQSTPTEIPFN